MEKIKLGVIGCGLISNVKSTCLFIKNLKRKSFRRIACVVKENAENSNRVSDGKAKVFTITKC